MKRTIASILCIILLFTCLTINVGAETIQNIEYFEDGSYVVTELVVSSPLARTAKSGSKTSTYYNSSNTAIFSVTLTGRFDYTYGTSAKATGASVSVNVYDSSATYVTKSATYGSATAYGSGTVSYLGYSRTLNVKITCDIYGNLT